MVWYDGPGNCANEDCIGALGFPPGYTWSWYAKEGVAYCGFASGSSKMAEGSRELLLVDGNMDGDSPVFFLDFLLTL